jgi:hypothetical protein
LFLASATTSWSGTASDLASASLEPAAPVREAALEPSPFLLMATAAQPNFKLAWNPLPAAHDEDEPQGIPVHPALTDRFFFGLGAGRLRSNTQARLNSDIGLGTNVDFEDILGLDGNSTVPEFLARWRFTERWRLEFEYFQLNRSGDKRLDQDVMWGDITFPAGAGVSTKFDVAVARVSCGYSFYKTKDKEVGAALGFHVTNFDVGIEGSAEEEGGDLLAPLPVGSVYAQMALSDEWALALRLDAFRIEYSQYSGHVFAVGVDALWQPWRHFGFGLGWRSLQIAGGVDTSDWNGEVSTDYQGPIVFISTSF